MLPQVWSSSTERNTARLPIQTSKKSWLSHLLSGTLHCYATISRWSSCIWIYFEALQICSFFSLGKSGRALSKNTFPVNFLKPLFSKGYLSKEISALAFKHLLLSGLQNISLTDILFLTAMTALTFRTVEARWAWELTVVGGIFRAEVTSWAWEAARLPSEIVVSSRNTRKWLAGPIWTKMAHGARASLIWKSCKKEE